MDFPEEPNRKLYAGSEVSVSFDPTVCEHAGFCVRGLPAAFDTQRRPWITPDGADADAVRAQVDRCPSDALRHHPGESAPNSGD